jgi:beta-glucosidase
MKNRCLFALLLLLLALHTTAQKKKEDFLNNLISQMTVEEKIGQLNLLTSDMDVTGPTLKAGYKKDVEAGLCGSIFNAYTPQFTRQLQEMAMRTRLKIPLLFGYDVIHGHKTIFPIPLGEACTWDMTLLEKSARIAAEEASADGLQWTYSPMVDIARDPRWGRVDEGVGEDTWYGTQVAKAKVKGYQGTDLSANNTILACVKHFALYGAIEGGRDYNTVDMSRRRMFQEYLPPYKAAIDAGAATVMSSFNEIDGIPATGNHWLLTDLLRRQWGFKGFVVTDYTSINEMLNHGIVKDEYEAGALALNAGVDMDMQGGIFASQLKKLLEDKKVTIESIDTAVYRILSAKYDLGLFTDPYRYYDTTRAKKVILSRQNLAEARNIAKRSIVLLKNESQLLPLKKNTHIALIGPLANSQRDMIGNWSAAGDYTKAVTLLDGLQQVASTHGGTVSYAKGAYYSSDTVLLKRALQKHDLSADDTANSAQLLQDAVALAEKSDIVVLALGESQGMTGEAASRSNISIPESQEALLRAVYATGKPVILVLMNGRPLTLEWEDAHIPAILETWFLGTEAGHAIADVIYGDYNPAGKITMTFPRNTGQIPIYYSHKNTGRPLNPDNKYTSKYLDVSNEPLYPFGYGLSYTHFTYGALTLNTQQLTANGKLTVSIPITNSGSYDGEEVVQCYIRDKVGSVTRPVKELKGFKKVLLKKGETQTITFTLTAEDLKFYDADMNWVAEPGDFSVFVGPNSRDVQAKDFILK